MDGRHDRAGDVAQLARGVAADVLRAHAREIQTQHHQAVAQLGELQRRLRPHGGAHSL